MPILRFDIVSLTYGVSPLLSHVDFQIESGERVCLVGKNGAGKTTLFRLITGAAVADEGEVWRQETLRVAHLEQEVPPDADQSIFEVVAAGLGELGGLLTEYHLTAQQAGNPDREILARLARLQARIEALDGWNINQKVETALTRLGLSADMRLADCSGGTRRQVMLARALVSAPDLLLLDEPTNHLDISAITELDRGRLTSFPGDFDGYLKKKDELLEIEARAAAKFDKKLAQEEVWIRQGVKARRTRNEGRVRALQALRTER